MEKKRDVLVIGAGHNGLVAAVLLARAGLSVTVVEEKATVGGACKTEKPFPKAPNLATSTGAYLLGVMPPELIALLGVDIPIVRRDPHYFLPTTDRRYLLFGSDRAATERQFRDFFSERDWKADEALQAEIAQIREDVAPTWMKEPLSIEADRRALRASRAAALIFVDLCRKPIADYLARFDFKSDLLRAMYAVTDGFSGLNGTWNTPGTGMNFLVHNMCRLPGSDGTFMIVRGGMGTVTGRIADAARKAGERPSRRTARSRRSWWIAGPCAVWLSREVRRSAPVWSSATRTLSGCSTRVGRSALPHDYNARIDGYLRDGTTMKINLALKGLPKFTCLPEDKGQYGPTIHLLPEEKDVLGSLQRGFDDVQAGRLPEFPTIEWYIHTTVDPSMKDEAGRHNSALFVQWVPYALSGGKHWDTEEDRYVKHLLSICDRFAPGTSDLVVDSFTLTPPKIEKHFGITRGHIHHVDNAFGFADRLPYATPIAGLYSASAGTHPAGSVIGCAGHNAAQRVLADLGHS